MHHLKQELFGNHKQKISENKKITKKLNVLTVYLEKHPEDKEIKDMVDKYRQKLKINNILMS